MVPSKLQPDPLTTLAWAMNTVTGNYTGSGSSVPVSGCKKMFEFLKFSDLHQNWIQLWKCAY